GLEEDPRFATNALRVANRVAFRDKVVVALSRWDRSELLLALEKATVPAGPINSVDQVFADPQVVARGMQVMENGIPAIRTPIRLSDTPLRR
ncbi:CoA transferase, partial [Marivivens donghaensis]|uniref:CoA transferase n=1 Tax=Marivivens donghaensis TaxID=1699413 RepID=UPI003F6971C1